MAFTRVKTRDIVAQQLPEFIRAEYPTFVSFVEAYYEFLDNNSVDLTEIRDIDTTLTDFIKYFKAELSHNYPIVSTNYDTERFLLKHIKDQYLAKGSEASYKLLFRLLFGKDVYMDYPGRQMLRVSDGRWTQDLSLFVRVDQGTPSALIGKTITIQTSKKIFNLEVVTNVDAANKITANVENVLPFDENNNIYEIFLNRNFYGQISPGDSIKYGSAFQGQILSCTNKIKISSPGQGFKPGQVFQVASGEGTPIWFKVLDTDDNGGLKNIDIIRFALNYTTDFSITVLPTSAVSTKKKFNKSAVAITYSLDEGTVGAVNVLDGGSNYQQVPDVIVGGNGSGATAHAVLQNGVVTDIYISNQGTGYQSAPIVQVTGGVGGSGVVAVAVMGTGNNVGKVVAVDILNGGSGYTTAPTITLVGGGPLTQATASAAINDGVVTKIIVDTIGIGYTNAFVNVVAKAGDTGSGAYGEVIMGSKYSYLYTDKTSGFTESGYINWGDYWASEYSDGAYVGTVARQFFVNARDTVAGNPALLNVSLGAVAKYPGYYKTNDGFLDDSMYIQDSYYYQAFAYVLKIDEQLQSYASVVRSMLHPSGMAMFGEYSINTNIGLQIALDSLVKSLGITLYDVLQNLSDTHTFDIIKDISESFHVVDVADVFGLYINLFKNIEDTFSVLDPSTQIIRNVAKVLGFGADTAQQVAMTEVWKQSFSKVISNNDSIAYLTPAANTEVWKQTFTKKILDTDAIAYASDFSGGQQYPTLSVSINIPTDTTSLVAADFGNTGYVVMEPYEQGGYFAEIYANGRASTW
jgi:hypothetical protein